MLVGSFDLEDFYGDDGWQPDAFIPIGRIPGQAKPAPGTMRRGTLRPMNQTAR